MAAVGDRAAALRYTSVARARRKATFSAVSAEVVQDYLTAAEAWVDRRTGRHFDSSSRTEVHDGKGGFTLWLKCIPVTSITSITITDDDGTSHSLDVSNDIVYNGATGELTFGPDNTSGYLRWPGEHPQNVSVVYTGGYAVGAVPDNIQEAVILRALATHMETSLYMSAGLASQKIGDGSQQRISREDIDRVMDQVYELLSDYMPTEVI